MIDTDPFSNLCDPQRPGDVILGVSREDPIGRELMNYAREGSLPGLEAVTEQARLDDVLRNLESQGPEDGPEGLIPMQADSEYDFSLLNVPEGEEQIAAVSLTRLHVRLATERSRSATPPIIAQPNHYMDWDGAAATGAALSGDHFRYLQDLGLSALPSAHVGPPIRVIDSGCTGAQVMTRTVNLLDGNSDVSDSVGHGSLITAIIDSCVAGTGTFEVFKVADATRKPTEWEVLQALSLGPMPPIINLSLSLGFGRVKCAQCGRQPVGARTSVFEERLRELRDRGVIVVAAAGNRSAAQLAYPSRFYSAVAVMASYGPPGQLAPYSNTGATDQAGRPHQNAFVCPGGYTRANEGPAVDASGKSVDGTSYASAYMTGLLTACWGQLSQCTVACELCHDLVLDRARQDADRGFPGFDPLKHGNGAAVLR